MDELSNSVVTIANARLALLGTGGIGKTSTALAVINDERVIQSFGTYRYWVLCVEATSVSMLIDLIAFSLGIPQGSNDRWKDITSLLADSRRRFLIVLDNFETPFDLPGKQRDVESVLSHLASFPAVSLLITMRATNPPPCIRWTKTQSKTLPVLDLDAARHLYLEFNPTAATDPDLDQLLIALDCMPLAVSLMARVSLYGETPGALLDRWNNQTSRGDILNLGSDRSTSVSLSIKASLDSPVMKRNPCAQSLLEVICMLPAGAWRGFMPALTPDIATECALISLLQTALVSIEPVSQMVRVLSPIRLHMLHYHPPNPARKRALYHAYIGLLEHNGSNPGDAKWEGAMKMLAVEEVNIDTILQDALADDSIDRNPALEACSTYAILQNGSCGRLDVINSAINIARSLSAIQLPHLLLAKGVTLVRRSKEYEAIPLYIEARHLFEELDDTTFVVYTILALGEALRSAGRNDEALVIHMEAYSIRSTIDDPELLGQCLLQLSDVYLQVDRLGEAEHCIMEALQVLKGLGCSFMEALCLGSLGDILRRLGRYTEAESCLIEARNMRADDRHIANVDRTLGSLYIKCGRLTEASQAFTSAEEVLRRLGDVSLADDCCQNLAYIRGLREGRFRP